jgi:hypothetical protein
MPVGLIIRLFDKGHWRAFHPGKRFGPCTDMSSLPLKELLRIVLRSVVCKLREASIIALNLELLSIDV